LMIFRDKLMAKGIALYFQLIELRVHFNALLFLFWKMLRRRSITRKAGIASKLKVSLAGVSMNAD
jgi:hypothetical protein